MEKSQREDVKDRYPNLADKVSITLKIVNRSFPYSKDDRMKEEVEYELDQGMYVNPKFKLKPREKVKVYNKSGEVWSGKVSIPSWAVKKCRYFRKQDNKKRKFVNGKEKDNSKVLF